MSDKMTPYMYHKIGVANNIDWFHSVGAFTADRLAGSKIARATTAKLPIPKGAVSIGEGIAFFFPTGEYEKRLFPGVENFVLVAQVIWLPAKKFGLEKSQVGCIYTFDTDIETLEGLSSLNGNVTQKSIEEVIGGLLVEYEDHIEESQLDEEDIEEIVRKIEFTSIGHTFINQVDRYLKQEFRNILSDIEKLHEGFDSIGR